MNNVEIIFNGSSINQNEGGYPDILELYEKKKKHQNIKLFFSKKILKIE